MTRSRSQRRTTLRTAFTLLEVVLALAIFFGAIAVLSQVTWNGTRAAVQAKLRGQALVRCEAVMQEVIAGAIPLSSQEGVTFEDDPTWSWSLVTQPTDLPELVFIEVTVAKSGGSSLSTASQTLRRWMRDPEVLVEAAREQAELQAELEASSSSNSSGSGSGSGGNSSAGGGTR